MSILFYKNSYVVKPKKFINYLPSLQLFKNINASAYSLAKRDNIDTKEKPAPPPSNTSFLQNLLSISNGDCTLDNSNLKVKKFIIPKERNTVPSDFVHLKTCYYSKKRLAQTSISPHGLRHHFDFAKKDFDSVKLIGNELLAVDDTIKETIKPKLNLSQPVKASTNTNEKIKDDVMDFTLY